MLKEHARIVAAGVLLLDLAAVAAAFLLAHALRETVLPAIGIVRGSTYPFESYLPLLLIALPIWALLLPALGTYRSYRALPFQQEAKDIARACVYGGLLFTLFLYYLRIEEKLLGGDRFSRAWALLFPLLAFLLLVLNRFLFRLTARYFRSRGLNFRNVLIVGSNQTAQAIAEAIQAHRYWGFRILGFLVEKEDPDPPSGHPVLGSPSELVDIVEAEAVDEVIFTASLNRYEDFEKTLLSLQELGVIMRFAFTPLSSAVGSVRLDELDGTPLVSWNQHRAGPVQLFLKRSVDILFSALILVFSAPLLLSIALAIRVSSGSPVLFRQTRSGLNGRRFTLLKFRTMTVDAEDDRQRIETLNEMSGPVFKVRNDPRVTRAGAFLRRFSLDEFPQLWNVLKGNMSLVGPRPPIPEEVAQYERWQKRRLSMRPGLTCLWQVSGRNEIGFERWMKLDLDYIDNWSPWLDLKILLKTIPVVLSGKGAY